MPPPDPPLVFAGAIDVGPHREHQEDGFGLHPELGLALVLDGMGGQRSGGYATRYFLADVPQRLSRALAAPAVSRDFALAAALAQSAEAFRVKAEAERRLGGCGASTVALAAAGYGCVTIAHVGDARAYRVRDGAIERLTEDHTLINEYLRVMPELDAAGVEQLENYRNVITRALGFAPCPIDARLEPTLPDDLFVLCTDGLWRFVDPQTILAAALACGPDLARGASDLVSRAIAADTNDNVTAVLVRVLPAAS